MWNLRSGSAASFVASPHYGASLTIVDAPELVKNVATRTLTAGHPPGTRVAITLKPRSRLIDGTEGRVLNRVLPLADAAGRGATLRDIPLAAYEVSAQLLLPDGTLRDLRVATGAPEASADGTHRTFRWQASATIDFVAAGTAASEAGRASARIAIGEGR